MVGTGWEGKGHVCHVSHQPVNPSGPGLGFALASIHHLSDPLGLKPEHWNHPENLWMISGPCPERFRVRASGAVPRRGSLCVKRVTRVEGKGGHDLWGEEQGDPPPGLAPDTRLVSNRVFLSPGYSHPALVKLVQQPQNVVSPRIVQRVCGDSEEIVHPSIHPSIL